MELNDPSLFAAVRRHGGGRFDAARDHAVRGRRPTPADLLRPRTTPAAARRRTAVHAALNRRGDDQRDVEKDPAVPGQRAPKSGGPADAEGSSPKRPIEKDDREDRNGQHGEPYAERTEHTEEET